MKENFKETTMTERITQGDEELTPVTPTSLQTLILAQDRLQFFYEQSGRQTEQSEKDRIGLMAQKQSQLIRDYTESLGDFDNRTMASNISHLVKKTGLRMGDIEHFLDLSTGYISRITKENNAKRISIDLVWKISRFFSVDLKTLLTVDLSMPQDNKQLLLRFIEKLKRLTLDDDVSWSNAGGLMDAPDDIILESGIVCADSETEDPNYVIKIKGKDIPLEDRIFLMDDPWGDYALAIISYNINSATHYTLAHIDTFASSSDPDGTCDCNVIYETSEDYSGVLAKATSDLIDAIAQKESDIKLSATSKKFIADFLSEENDQ